MAICLGFAALHLIVTLAIRRKFDRHGFPSWASDMLVSSRVHFSGAAVSPESLIIKS
jgi:hypothetical protein